MHTTTIPRLLQRSSSLRLLSVFAAGLLATAPLAAAQVAVFRPDGDAFKEAAAGLASELPKDWTVQTIAAGSDLAKTLAANPPDVLVAMDNAQISKALALAKSDDPKLAKVPVVALMGLNLKPLLAGHDNACGIAYEVPMYSIVTRFTKRTGATVNKVLIIHRGSTHGVDVADATRQLARGGIEVEAVDIERDARTKPGTARWFDRNLLGYARSKVDAVVVVPDNQLLNAGTLAHWVKAARGSGKPFIAGLGPLVDEANPFCAYAALPDHERLGAQAAELVRQIGAGEAKPADLGVEYLVAVGEKIDPGQLTTLGLTATATE